MSTWGETSSVAPLLREDAPAESTGKGSWRNSAPPATSLSSPWVPERPSLLRRRPSLPRHAQLSRERHIPSRGESVVGFFTESTQTFLDDPRNSSILATDCDVKHPFQRLTRSFNKRCLQMWVSTFPRRNALLSGSQGVLTHLPGRGTESLHLLRWPGWHLLPPLETWE